MKKESVSAFVALGANLGDSPATLRWALTAIAALTGTRLVRSSSLYRSAPIDSSGPDYINAVAEVATTLHAPALLAALQQIELAAGRERPYRNAPRTLDLDILLYGDATASDDTPSAPKKRRRRRKSGATKNEAPPAGGTDA